MRGRAADLDMHPGIAFFNQCLSLVAVVNTHY